MRRNPPPAPPGSLLESMLATDVVMAEHIRDSQRHVEGREMTADDVETLQLVLEGTGIDAEEIPALGVWVCESVLHDALRASAALRAVKSSTLRALIFGVWFNGLAVGARYAKGIGTTTEAES